MTLGVDPAQMRIAAREVDNSADDTKTIHSYVDRYGQLSQFDLGIAFLFKEGHSHLFGQLNAVLTDLRRILTASGAELDRSAAHYEHADKQSAADVDVKLPAVPRGPYFDSQQPHYNPEPDPYTGLLTY